MNTDMNGKMMLFAGESHKELAKAICKHLNIELGKSETIRFSNGNLLVRILESVRECDVFVLQTSTTPHLHRHIFELLIFLDALKRASAKRVTAVLPYFPYARSDKKDQPRISITARLMVNLLQAAGADRVLTIDLHSDQIQGFFDLECPTDQLTAKHLLCSELSEYKGKAVAVAADVGEAKGVGSPAKLLDLPIAIVDKRRYGNDEQPRAEYLVGDVEGKDSIIFDDEIASAGTIVEAAEFVSKRGARTVTAAVTHAVLSGSAPEKIENSCIDQVLTTDTIPIPPEKRFEGLKVLSVAPLLAEAIRRIHEGVSISSLRNKK